MRDLKLLIPKAQELHARFARDMALAGLNYIITSTLRTVAEQEALYAQGREPVAVVNALRKLAGWGAIGPVEAAKKVTWTMQSRHLTGRAFDIALLGVSGRPHWSEKVSVNANQEADYLEAAKIGQRVGLIAGGLWNNPDFPHFEVPA